eukprot:4766244-Pleurochrysis_carterae.AAC.1
MWLAAQAGALGGDPGGQAAGVQCAGTQGAAVATSVRPPLTDECAQALPSLAYAPAQTRAESFGVGGEANQQAALRNQLQAQLAQHTLRRYEEEMPRGQLPSAQAASRVDAPAGTRGGCCTGAATQPQSQFMCMPAQMCAPSHAEVQTANLATQAENQQMKMMQLQQQQQQLKLQQQQQKVRQQQVQQQQVQQQQAKQQQVQQQLQQLQQQQQQQQQQQHQQQQQQALQQQLMQHQMLQQQIQMRPMTAHSPQLAPPRAGRQVRSSDNAEARLQPSAESSSIINTSCASRLQSGPGVLGCNSLCSLPTEQCAAELWRFAPAACLPAHAVQGQSAMPQAQSAMPQVAPPSRSMMHARCPCAPALEATSLQFWRRVFLLACPSCSSSTLSRQNIKTACTCCACSLQSRRHAQLRGPVPPLPALRAIPSRAIPKCSPWSE